MPHANPEHNVFDVCCRPECSDSVAHSRMYISAFSLLSGTRSVPRKAHADYRDVLAAKRQRERESEERERERERVRGKERDGGKNS